LASVLSRNVIKACSNCSMCRDECPTYYTRKAESYFAGGRLRVLRAYIEKGYPVDDDFVEAMYYCTTCKQCEDRCPVPVNYVDIIEALRATLVRNHVGPYGKQLSLARNTADLKNPYGEKADSREDWLKDGDSMIQGIKTVEKGPVGYFVGCTASFRTKTAAQSTAKILSKFYPGGIVLLGNGEYCCGSPLIRTGQEDFDLEMADGRTVRFRVKDLITHNVEALIKRGVKEVVFSCSGCYKTSMESWPQYYDGEVPFTRTHITQFLARKIDEGAVHFKPLYKKITFHDPCHLGRHRGEYDAPRKILNAIPGLDFVEMQYIKNRARCCGAGGGVKSGYPKDALEISKIRVQEAIDTGADILLTSCVFCKYNFLDAVKDMNASIEVLNTEDLVVDLVVPGTAPDASEENGDQEYLLQI
jgi:heterodisulfide reductase subunit D